MGSLQELGSEQEVDGFISSNKNSVVVFSAHWCGPCKRSKPALEKLANEMAQDVTLSIHFGIVYENDLSDAIQKYNVKAFPTYVLYQSQKEVSRVEGANLQGVEEMVLKAGCKELTGGETLGGCNTTPLSPEEARTARLAKLGGSVPPQAAAAEQTTPMQTNEDDSKKPAVEASVTNEEDVEMKDANDASADSNVEDPTKDLDKAAIDTLTGEMGFSLLRAQKGLLNGGNQLDGAVEWLMQHQDDADIDEPIPLNSSNTTAKAQSYKCNECGKILSNMANLELHANKTGHSDFEESTCVVVPLTAEEKAAKILQIKELLQAKREEREMGEKKDDKEREQQRRFMGKEMSKTREQMEIEARKREAQLRRKEKKEYQKERARLRAELAKDKAERASNKGKKSSRLGVDGYQPDGIQYDVKTGGGDDAIDDSERQAKKAKADATKITNYIAKVASYRAGGDGGKCLKVLKAYVSNVADNPDEAKYKSIKTDNKVFKTKVKPFVGAKQLLLAVGFSPTDDGNALVLTNEATDLELLSDTKNKLIAAMEEYNK